MLRSMTGYGRSEGYGDGVFIRVEIRSVNYRFLDVTVRMPREYLMLEDLVKKEVQSHFHRGRLDTFVTIEPDLATLSQVDVNWAYVERLIQSAREVKDRFGLPGELTVQDLVQMPDVLSVPEPEGNEDTWRELLVTHVRKACTDLQEMRVAEGVALQEDLEERIGRIVRELEAIREQAPQVVTSYRDRIRERMKELLGDLEIEEERLLTEAALFADKCNIDEELTRLDSHCKQFLHTLKQATPVGRKLDFLIQEMNREINTIASKANNLSISQHVIEAKSELEKIREQVQNIE